MTVALIFSTAASAAVGAGMAGPVQLDRRAARVASAASAATSAKRARVEPPGPLRDEGGGKPPVAGAKRGGGAATLVPISVALAEADGGPLKRVKQAAVRVSPRSAQAFSMQQQVATERQQARARRSHHVPQKSTSHNPLARPSGSGRAANSPIRVTTSRSQAQREREAAKAVERSKGALAQAMSSLFDD